MKPVKVSLEADKKYHYCTCVKGIDFVPKAFSVNVTKEYHLCPCMKTNNAPFCDGSHAK